MPYYDFENIETGKIVTLFFHMNDTKSYNGENNNEIGKWRRSYNVPKMSVSSLVPDPFNQKQFVATTENKKGQTFGQAMERSAELSERRAIKYGQDPFRDKIYSDYQKRTGVKHPQKAKEDAARVSKEVIKNFLKP